MERIKRSFVAGLLCVSTVFAFSACASGKAPVPVVALDGNEITVNGKVVAQTEGNLYVNRIDNSVVSLSLRSTVSADGSVDVVNVDPDGNEIKLSSVIPDRELYESSVVKNMGLPIIYTRDAVYDEPEVDMELVREVLCSYDEAMKLPFIMYYDGVSIIYTQENGASYSVSFDYNSGVIDEKYVPDDGVICHPWMIGRVGNGVDGMILDGYSDHWAESSLEIDNYKGHTYLWFCVAYTDAEDNKTYYSVIAKVTDNGREVVSSKQVDGSFVCCDIKEFSRTLAGK